MPGHAATVIFTVQREDVRVDCGVRPSDFHDPTFAAAMRDAASKGVRILRLEGSKRNKLKNGMNALEWMDE